MNYSTYLLEKIYKKQDYLLESGDDDLSEAIQCAIIISNSIDYNYIKKEFSSNGKFAEFTNIIPFIQNEEKFTKKKFELFAESGLLNKVNKLIGRSNNGDDYVYEHDSQGNGYFPKLKRSLSPSSKADTYTSADIFIYKKGYTPNIKNTKEYNAEFNAKNFFPISLKKSSKVKLDTITEDFFKEGLTFEIEFLDFNETGNQSIDFRVYKNKELFNDIEIAFRSSHSEISSVSIIPKLKNAEYQLSRLGEVLTTNFKNVSVNFLKKIKNAPIFTDNMEDYLEDELFFSHNSKTKELEFDEKKFKSIFKSINSLLNNQFVFDEDKIKTNFSNIENVNKVIFSDIKTIEADIKKCRNIIESLFKKYADVKDGETVIIQDALDDASMIKRALAFLSKTSLLEELMTNKSIAKTIFKGIMAFSQGVNYYLVH